MINRKQETGNRKKHEEGIRFEGEKASDTLMKGRFTMFAFRFRFSVKCFGRFWSRRSWQTRFLPLSSAGLMRNVSLPLLLGLSSFCMNFSPLSFFLSFFLSNFLSFLFPCCILKGLVRSCAEYWCQTLRVEEDRAAINAIILQFCAKKEAKGYWW